jgi:hypothetical protein
MQMCRAALAGALTDITAAAAELDPAAVFVGIASAIVDNGVDTVLADVTQPAAASYPKTAVTTWSTLSDLVDGSPVRDSPIKTFRPPDNTHPTTVSYVILTTLAVAGDLIAFFPVNPSVNLAVTTDSFSVVVRVMLDATGRWDASVKWNG